jgi:hypothetical protein
MDTQKQAAERAPIGARLANSRRVLPSARSSPDQQAPSQGRRSMPASGKRTRAEIIAAMTESPSQKKKRQSGEKKGAAKKAPPKKASEASSTPTKKNK